jgi:hypothetical protein
MLRHDVLNSVFKCGFPADQIIFLHQGYAHDRSGARLALLVRADEVIE